MKEPMGIIRGTRWNKYVMKKGKSRNPFLSGPNAGDLERSTVVERG